MTAQTMTNPKAAHARKPRRIGHVGQAYLEAQEKAKAAQRKNAAAGIARIAGGMK